MITFLDFLREDEDQVATVSDLIKRDCKPWLKASGGFAAFRGMNVGDSLCQKVKDHKGLYVAKVRTDRIPKDSPPWLHNTMNSYFTEKTGTPLRSASIFAAGSNDTASEYAPHGPGENRVCSIFPIGEFEYAWSKEIDDPTHALYIYPMGHSNVGKLPTFRKFWASKAKSWHIPLDPDEYLKEFSYELNTSHNYWERMVTAFIEEANAWTFNEGLRECLTKYRSHEVMIKCDKFYAVTLGTASKLEL